MRVFPLLIHIGYHKTATSWLQQVIFSNCKLGFVSPWSRGRIAKDIINVDAFRFDPVSVAPEYLADVQRISNKGCIAVLSHERLSGYPASGGFDSKLVADRLFDCFHQAKVLIVIREQKSAIRSWYTQYIRDGGGLSLRRFLKNTEIGLFRMPGFRRDFFEYDGLISYYQKLFSPRNVLVLPFELFAMSRKGFLDRLGLFLGIEFSEVPLVEKINPSATALHVVFGCLGNRFFSLNQLNKYAFVNSEFMRKSFWKIGEIASCRASLTVRNYFENNLRSEIGRFVGDYYQQSNKKTSALIGVKLDDFGYDS
jgi:hypothetical protein